MREYRGQIMLDYKGYRATLVIDTDHHVIYGIVQDIRGVIHFEGDTIPEAMQAFHDSVDDYLGFCETLGCTPEK
jgi:predicted HicB family RNase H-like nuclease